MLRGDTRLKEQCRYLVYRRKEKFLAESEKEPQTSDGSTIYIPYRRKKDPREIPILDPAVGSAHFLLYCFGLLQTIYEEA
jgi:type II restriction/modification system DNA methylase subunit YeeA